MTFALNPSGGAHTLGIPNTTPKVQSTPGVVRPSRWEQAVARWAHIANFRNPQGLGPCILWSGRIDHRGSGRLDSYIKWQTIEGFSQTSSSPTVVRYLFSLINDITLKEMIQYSLLMINQCGNKSCINLDHYQLITASERYYTGVQNAAKTHCPKGHPYKVEGRKRSCPLCHRVAGHKYDKRIRAEIAKRLRGTVEVRDIDLINLTEAELQSKIETALKGE